MGVKAGLTWLHISDFHFKSGSFYERDLVTNALVASLPSLSQRIDTPDFVLASGDIAFSGKKEEFEEATKFFDAILERLKLPKSRLIVIPGNHDVDRTKSIGLTRTMKDQQEALQYFSSGDPIRHIEHKLSAFKAWYDEYFQGEKEFDVCSSCQGIESFLIGDINLNILPINTATFCVDDHDIGNLFVGRSCIDKACAALPNKAQRTVLNVAIMHHPFDWLSEVELAQIKSAIRAHFDCFLRGHLHSTDIENVSGLNGDILQLAAGATYQTIKYPNTAMICSFSDDRLTVCPIRYEDTPTPLWTIDPSIFPGESNFSKSYLLKIHPSNNPLFSAEKLNVTKSTEAMTQEDWADNLLVSPNGETLYVEPRLFDRPQSISLEEEESSPGRVLIDDIVESDRSFFVLAKSEAGGTTVCKRIEMEFATKARGHAIYCDARTLPNYRKKLESIFVPQTKVRAANVLILDNLDFDQDERLLKEIASCGLFQRIIAVVPDRGLEVSVPSDDSLFMNGRKVVHLWGLSRENIRQLAMVIFSSSDQTFISEIVDKVYRDLLWLCIPLTPNNIIMYLRTLYKEGKYLPINRVDIIGRYLYEILQSPGEIYGRDLNAKNKTEILAAFCFCLYQDQKSFFDDHYWFKFISKYQDASLLEFDANKLFRDLFVARIFYRYDTQIFIRYTFYFHFYLGKYLSSHPPALSEFVQHEEYLRVGGVIEIVTGLSSNNNDILERLTSRTEELLKEFSNKYIELDFDVIHKTKWVERDDEEERLWKPVARLIEAGPKNAKEIDEIKSSLLDEARTSDQQLRFSKFVALEIALFTTARLLKDALRNSDDADGAIKVRALRATSTSAMVAYQVGTTLIPRIAERRFLQWGGVAFFGFNSAGRPTEPTLSQDERYFLIARALCVSISMQEAEEIATAKLSPVFRHVAGSVESDSFLGFVIFRCVLLSKGQGWAETLEGMIRSADKNALYLNLMLRALTGHLRYEILHNKDRAAIEKIIAHIQAKRALGKQQPGSRAIQKITRGLQKSGRLKGLKRPRPK